MKTLKTIDCVVVYNLLKGASLGKMESKNKFAVIKSIKELKTIAEDFEAFRTDAAEKLRGENHDEMQQKAVDWQQKGDKCTLTDDEKREVNAYFDRYGKELSDCINEEAEKEHELDIRTITEEAFGALMDANESWSVEQIMKVQEVMTE